MPEKYVTLQKMTQGELPPRPSDREERLFIDSDGKLKSLSGATGEVADVEVAEGIVDSAIPKSASFTAEADRTYLVDTNNFGVEVPEILPTLTLNGIVFTGRAGNSISSIGFNFDGGLGDRYYAGSGTSWEIGGDADTATLSQIVAMVNNDMDAPFTAALVDDTTGNDPIGTAFNSGDLSGGQAAAYSPIIATLPSSPTEGMRIAFADAQGTWDANPLALDPSGGKIFGVSGLFEVRQPSSVEVLWTGTERGWVVAPSVARTFHRLVDGFDWNTIQNDDVLLVLEPVSDITVTRPLSGLRVYTFGDFAVSFVDNGNRNSLTIPSFSYAAFNINPTGYPGGFKFDVSEGPTQLGPSYITGSKEFASPVTVPAAVSGGHALNRDTADARLDQRLATTTEGNQQRSTTQLITPALLRSQTTANASATVTLTAASDLRQILAPQTTDRDVILPEINATPSGNQVGYGHVYEILHDGAANSLVVKNFTSTVMARIDVGENASFIATSSGWIVTKNFRAGPVTIIFPGIDLTAAAASTTIYTPISGITFHPVAALLRNDTVGGTISTPAQAQIDNGTNGNDLFASLTLTSPATGRAFPFSLATQPFVVDASKPLRLRRTVAASGTSPVHTGTLLVTGILY